MSSSVVDAKVFLTSKDSCNRLTEQTRLEFVPNDPAYGGAMVSVDTSVKYQRIEGFGGAFTEAGAVTLAKIPEELQKEALEAYFSQENGNAYSLCRSHMNSCDFATGNYSCCDREGDIALESFNINRDLLKLIPMIRAGRSIAGASLKLFISPWSPPAWMKTNGMMNRGGKLKAEYREVWAEYYCRFIKEYEKEGIPIWGLSVQNEPGTSQKWDSCIYTAEEERDFVRDYLGPALHRNGLEELNVIIWDHNRDFVFERGRRVLEDPEAAKYIWGTGFHWYESENFGNLSALHDMFPEKKLLFTEGCQEEGPHLGSWKTGERYGHSMINDLNNWSVGWVDWNMFLDETGGPNHVGNLCSAPIIVDTVNARLLYQSSYYYIGHFSRFIRPEACRVLCATTMDELEASAFLNSDGTLATVVMNASDCEQHFRFNYGKDSAPFTLPAHSICTFTLRDS